MVAATFEEALSMCARASPPSATSASSPIIESVFVIGGGCIYAAALASPLCTAVHVTEVLEDVPDVDTFIPVINASVFTLARRSRVKTEGGVRFRFAEYRRVQEDDPDADLMILPTPSLLPSPPGLPATTCSSSSSQPHTTTECNHDEQAYLDIVRDILDSGVRRGDRTGTGTLSKFGVQIRFDLRDGVMPPLTTKKVFWRGDYCAIIV